MDEIEQKREREEWKQIDNDIEQLRKNKHNHNFDSKSLVCIYCGIAKCDYLITCTPTSSIEDLKMKCPGVSNK